MTDNLRKCMDKLIFLNSIKDDKLRKSVLLTISDDCLFNSLQEIAKNYHSIIKPKLSIKNKKLMKGKNEKNIFSYINKSKKFKTKISKKKLMLQSGGWLPIIIPTVASEDQYIMKQKILQVFLQLKSFIMQQNKFYLI